MGNRLQTLEPAAKVLAATALSQSLSFCTERKYLEKIGNKDLNDIFSLEAIPCTLKEEATWIEIRQIGKPLEESSESCFTAIQKILYSSFLPKETQLLFLIVGNGSESKLYLGLRAMGENIHSKSIVKYLNEFIKGTWPGLQTSVISESDENLTNLKKDIANDVFENIYALTGIPSMEGQYKNLYPATIDKLIAGMNKSKHYVYLVVADPIEPNDADFMLYQCREMNGQAESLKSMNITESISRGTSNSHTISDSYTQGTSESIQKRDFSKLGKLALKATGLGLAASVFPAAGSLLEGLSDATGALLPTAANMLGTTIGLSGIGNILTGTAPTKSTSTSESTTKGTSDTYGTNESQSESLSRNIVNKHIEAVSEHLFYHSKRLETGKAIGLWKVGTYLMAEKKSDIQGAALQLRSILSGQESIFEPIRIHDISNILDEEDDVNDRTLREMSLGHLNAPTLMINTRKGKRFDHPLGEHYKELRTVLTTKELSYLINFPLRSVPGISVIDSCPDFSLNQLDIAPEKRTIEFGKLLYGGSETEIPYQLPIDLLAKHTLLSGINGTGKTNTVQAILNKLSENVPFLVIEPAKTEYVDWAIEYNKLHPDNPISIFIPGCKTYKDKTNRKEIKISPLKINPFEIVWLDKEQEPNILTHIDRLKSIFAAAFPMYDILPVLMEDLIYTVYQNNTTNWLSKEPVFGKTLPPTLNSMTLSVNEVIINRQYEERVERNMKACLNTRIDSLKRGWKGEMLNTLHSTPWNELFEKPCIINLSYVGDDTDKAFFMALILQFLYEYCTAKAELGMIDFNNNRCNHLTVIEEAHRVMMKCDNPELPQYKSAMMFSNMLSEIRAYGEGLLLVDQVPTRLIPDAIKNTNIKITHRLVAEDDCKAIGEAMGINKEQRRIIPKLLVGQCIISTALSTDEHWIKVKKVK
ncbi:ATP-binding protein [Phocaeicola plebeius]|uniref:ATP-binding protein n=1 Tax=Phocaeicola plebeius TaxID=310297 RepID=UPI0029421031|nr:DUF87 domain-containing protein [Phocaeicola plebeius]